MHLRHYTNGSTKKPSRGGLTWHEVANIEVFSRGVVRAESSPIQRIAVCRRASPQPATMVTAVCQQARLASGVFPRVEWAVGTKQVVLVVESPFLLVWTKHANGS